MSSSSSANEILETESNRYQTENATIIKNNVNLALKQAICWAIMFGVSENIFSLFAIHLNAPLFILSALTWIPGFLGPFIQILSTNILEVYHNRVKLIFTSVFIQAFCYLPLFIIALFPPEIKEATAPKEMTLALYIFLISFLFITFGGHFSAPPWQSLVGDLIKKNERGIFFARMSRLNQFFSLATLMLVSYVLYIVSSKYNNSIEVLSYVFAGCFLIAFTARFFSGNFIRKMAETPFLAPQGSSFTFWQFIKRAPESNFVRFVIFTAVLNCGACIAAPYFVNYWIKTLHYSKTEWLILQALSTIASIFTLLIWGRFSDIFGNKKTLKYSSFIISIVPFFWLISNNLYYLFLLNIIGPIFWTGFNLSTVNYIYEAASQPKRARCFAYYSLINGIGILIGANIGWLIEKYSGTQFFGHQFNSPFCWVLIISGFVRLSACFGFLSSFKELRDVKAFDINSFWVDVLHIRSVFGISLIKNTSDSNTQK
jgi:MFS family permease